MAEFEQLFSAICGNGHVQSNYIERPVPAGYEGIPKMCPKCSAPVHVNCANCGDAILGHRRYPGVIDARAKPKKPWFCHECGQPYVWASNEQLNQWFESKFTFDQEIDEDTRDELLAMVAQLAHAEAEGKPFDVKAFRALLERVPRLYTEVKPYLPIVAAAVQQHFQH